MTTNDISTRIRVEITRQGRLIGEVRAAANINRGRWYAAMADPDKWTAGELRKLADVLGVTLSTLTGGRDAA